jgi:LysM repeat protein
MKLKTLLAVALLATALGACSSSKKSDSDLDSVDAIPMDDAGTDAVPAPVDGATSADAGLDEVPPSDAPAPVAEQQPAADQQQQPVAEQPAAPAESTPEASVAGEATDYTVQAGDTLMKIAFENYGDLFQWKHIYEMNKDKIPNPNALVHGTVLKLDKPVSPVAIEKNGESYLIKAGDTLGTISDDVYGTKAKWKRLWENNKTLIKDPNRIFAGFYLYYTMTPEDVQEKEQLKGHQPLAEAPAPSADSLRDPANAGITTPDAGTTPVAAQ